MELNGTSYLYNGSLWRDLAAVVPSLRAVAAGHLARGKHPDGAYPRRLVFHIPDAAACSFAHTRAEADLVCSRRARLRGPGSGRKRYLAVKPIRGGYLFCGSNDHACRRRELLPVLADFPLCETR